MPRTALLTLPDVKTHLGLEGNEDDVLLSNLLTQTVALLESELGRSKLPFQGAQTARIEVRDGTGTGTLVLDYVPTAITSIKLGEDSAVPDETLAVADKKVLAWGVNDRVLRRVDGKKFGELDRPRYVELTYNAAEDLPQMVRTLVLRTVGALFGTRGREGRGALSEGGISEDFREQLYRDPLFEAVMNEHGRLVMR